MNYTNLGAKQRPRDDRDVKLGSVQAPVSIPATFMPDDSWLQRNYQGPLPTCGAHASSHLKAILDHIANPVSSPRYTPRFSWIRIKSFDGFPLEDGTDMRSIFKSQQADGMDDYDPLQNDVTLPVDAYSAQSAITPDMTANARPKIIKSYAFGETDYESLCQHIFQNGAVLLLIKCDDGFWGTSTPTFTSPKYGHFVVADGYYPNGIRVIDSADPNDAFSRKLIAKQYITPTFIYESGTAVDMPPPPKNTPAPTATVVIPTDIAPSQANVTILQQIVLKLKALLTLLKGQNQNTGSMDYNIFKSKTNWTLVITVAIAIGNAVVPFLSADKQAIATTILLALAGLFHVDGVQKAALASAAASRPISGQ